MPIQFYLNGELCREEGISPTTTVLDYLREYAGQTGTKEGCAEGDCGACTIVLVRYNEDGKPIYEAVNSCLLILPQLDGTNIITVEGISQNYDLDPVQVAMVENDGTQCGFCTPGFIMALFALRQSDEEVTDDVIHDALAGNLCRCTGYRPIVESARQTCGENARDLFSEIEPLTSEGSYHHKGQKFMLPNNLNEFLQERDNHPDAIILAGGTDLGLRFSKERDPYPEIIYTSKINELLKIAENEKYLEIGASVTYTRLLPYMERLYPSFATLIMRIGSRQIRNVGTLVGNIATASPIGDTLPCLIALDATLLLVSDGCLRELPVEEFFIGYRRTDLKTGEVIKGVRIPKLKDKQTFRAYKVSKRHDQDISSVIGAFRFELENQIITDTRIAFGGMAETPKRAAECEKVFFSKKFSENLAFEAGLAITGEFSPISDHRASEEYRLSVAQNLLIRLYRDLTTAEDLTEVTFA